MKSLLLWNSLFVVVTTVGGSSRSQPLHTTFIDIKLVHFILKWLLNSLLAAFITSVISVWDVSAASCWQNPFQKCSGHIQIYEGLCTLTWSAVFRCSTWVPHVCFNTLADVRIAHSLLKRRNDAVLIFVNFTTINRNILWVNCSTLHHHLLRCDTHAAHTAEGFLNAFPT